MPSGMQTIPGKAQASTEQMMMIGRKFKQKIPGPVCLLKNYDANSMFFLHANGKISTEKDALGARSN